MLSSHEGRAVVAGRQLEFWNATSASVEAHGLRVIRRDGRESLFDVDTLSASILRAGWPGESLDGDTALSLARAVGLFLQHSSSSPVTVETLRQTVERLLLDMGYGLSARMYAGAFAPVAESSIEGDGAAGMFEEALPIERAERAFAALAADAGVDAANAAELVPALLAQLRAAGLRRATPALLREWLRSELHARGLVEAAARIARIALPVSALHDSFSGDGRGASSDPESASLALARRVSAAYVIGQRLPSRAGQAHLRGEIHVRGTGDFLRLDSVSVDLEALKADGTLNPGVVSPNRRARSVDELSIQMRSQEKILARYFGGGVRWAAVNFGFAPYVEECDDSELRDIAHALFARPADIADRGRATEIGLAWDAPENYPLELIGAQDATRSIDDMYVPARRFFAAAIEVLSTLSSSGWAAPQVRPVLHLTPYFFGAPDAPELLGDIGRIAAGPIPVALRYEASAPMLFEHAANRGAAQVSAQTVCLSVVRAAKLADGPEALMRRLDAALDAAVAAHRTKHQYLGQVLRERSGPLALLGRRFGRGPFVDLDTLEYRIALEGASVGGLARADVPWIAHGDEPAIAEAAVHHLREACARWSVATGLRIVLADAQSTRQRPELSDRPLLVSRPAEAVALEGHVHPLYDLSPYFVVSGESFATACDAADFIRHAFLHTSCRALLFA